MIRLYAIGVIGIAAIVVSALATPSFERLLTSWRLLPESEQLTVLAMSNPQHLPTNYTPGKPMTFGFSIQNDHDVTETYYYKISETNEADDQIALLHTDVIILSAGQKKDIMLTVMPVLQSQRSYINVAISNGEQVGFWAEQTGK